ncbi:putative FRE ferric reductase-like transmembrane component [Neohortaea acidophila]|uniref:Putative FRE ferric reductase-like transmembrane component n=1 Tax=Neohortaea acidophila TaxID=245834 RepID=A0A6A6PN84_9PEZI|nr:putative FRE ferric reductase-like transmembrane component [Neohortaea acidophila]KAF2480893.1 putative FRE ferric reductase-like transmembrane component [Neohortaea acidophila]
MESRDAANLVAPDGPITHLAARAVNATSSSLGPAAAFTQGLNGVNQPLNYLYVNVLVISFCGLLAITLLYRWLQMGNSHIRHLCAMGRWEDQRYWMFNRGTFWPAMKQRLIYAPLFHKRHNREIQLSKAINVGTLPSRYHTIVIMLYLFSNIAYILALPYTESSKAALWAAIRGRSGILAVLNLIPTVVFALRNNPLMSLLGVSYDTFNLLHRWCARVMVIEATIHTIAWAVNSMAAGGLTYLNSSLTDSVSYTWGMVGMGAFFFIFLTACSPIRHAFYETFLNGHRILVAIGIVGVYIHLDAAGLPQVPYCQLVLALWFAEYVFRTGRILMYNFSRQKGITKVTAEALPAEACRVTFEISRPWHWKPGCHVHAYLPMIALWSSHPFSVAWAENRSRDASLAPPAYEADDTSMAFTRGADVSTVSLIIRARTGMTRKLYEKAAASPTGIITTWGAIEGPYGGHESFTSYGTVILFAGGVGITHCVGYVHHLLSQYQAGTTVCRKILLVWSVPNTEALEWVRTWMDKILRMEGRRDVLRIQLFVTKPRHRGEVVSNTGSVQMFPGRCNPQTILQKEMQDRIGAMGVTVCGPGAFADSVRAAVRDVTTEGCVDFIEEAFTY